MAVALVGFAGLAGAGKDTCADVLVERGFSKAAFAKPLKVACRHIFELTDDQLWGHLKDVPDSRWNRTPRELMQLFGTDFMRMRIRDDVWIDKLMRDIDPTNPTVVCDVRFQDEADAILARGGRVYVVVRSGHVGTDAHCSERPDQLVHISGTILNDGSLDTLRAKLHRLVDDFLTTA